MISDIRVSANGPIEVLILSNKLVIATPNPKSFMSAVNASNASEMSVKIVVFAAQSLNTFDVAVNAGPNDFVNGATMFISNCSLIFLNVC